MSWLLFLDESGHDHRNMPYEVRGGIALHAGNKRMSATVRDEIASEFGPWLNRLQFEGEGYRDGNVYHTYGIVFVPDPYTARSGSA